MSIIAVLFPGQGSQEKGMGRDMAEGRPEAMDLWRLAENKSGLALRGIFWDGAEADMADTRALQPALTVVNLAFWQMLGAKLAPMALAGHSLGEFAALAAAGVLGVEDVLELTALRGRLMSEVKNPGDGMAAVLKLPQDAVEDVVSVARDVTNAELRIANYNSPEQYVLSGKKAALDAAAGLVREQKGRLIPLPVSGAFHSPLIQEAADEFAKILAKKSWREPRIPVFHNATATCEADPAKIRAAVTAQMTSSVLWIQTMAAQHKAGARTWFELGPKGVLAKLAKANLKGCEECEAHGVGTLDLAQAVLDQEPQEMLSACTNTKRMKDQKDEE